MRRTTRHAAAAMAGLRLRPITDEGVLAHCGCGVAYPRLRQRRGWCLRLLRQRRPVGTAPAGQHEPVTFRSARPHTGGWRCADSDYTDLYCDCGCGAFDPACADGTVDSCDFCTLIGCLRRGEACPGQHQRRRQLPLHLAGGLDRAAPHTTEPMMVATAAAAPSIRTARTWWSKRVGIAPA